MARLQYAQRVNFHCCFAHTEQNNVKRVFIGLISHCCYVFLRQMYKINTSSLDQSVFTPLAHPDGGYINSTPVILHVHVWKCELLCVWLEDFCPTERKSPQYRQKS